MMDEYQAEIDGQRAFEQGKGSDANPHSAWDGYGKLTCLYDAWLLGWITARDEATRPLDDGE